MERYVFEGVFVHVDQTTESGQTTIKRTEETCSKSPSGDVVCTSRDLSGHEPPWRSVTRVDTTGVYGLGGGDDSGFSYTMTPPLLQLPANVRAGSTWTATFATEFRTKEGAPDVRHATKRFRVVASTSCPGGLLVKAKKTEGKRRSTSESLYCPGMAAPARVSVQIFKDDALVRSIVSVVEDLPLAP